MVKRTDRTPLSVGPLVWCFVSAAHIFKGGTEGKQASCRSPLPVVASLQLGHVLARLSHGAWTLPGIDDKHGAQAPRATLGCGWRKQRNSQLEHGETGTLCLPVFVHRHEHAAHVCTQGLVSPGVVCEEGPVLNKGNSAPVPSPVPRTPGIFLVIRTQ